MPNELTQTLLNDYKPMMAITVYRSDHDYYLESHDINEAGEVLAGKPLLQETIQSVVDCFFDERQNSTNISGLVPDNMLSFKVLPGGHYKMVWYRPSERRVIYHAVQLKIKTAAVWVPAVLYVADRNHLSVYTFKTDKRPTEATKLHLAPFFNVNDAGDVCLGSAKVQKPKEKTYSNLMKYWEDTFWLSEFTHVNGKDKIKSGDLQKLWRTLVGTRKRFPTNELLITKKTVKNII